MVSRTWHVIGSFGLVGVDEGRGSRVVFVVFMEEGGDRGSSIVVISIRVGGWRGDFLHLSYASNNPL